MARVRELKAELASVKARLSQAEAERDALLAHMPLALVALHDFEQLGTEGRLRIIDGWNAILRCRNVSKLTSENISALKAEYLAGLGIARLVKTAEGTHALSAASVTEHLPVDTWIVFDGSEENAYRSGRYRVTYTGGMGAHRADRMILDYVHAVKLLGLDVARITVVTSDKALCRKASLLGANVVPESSGGDVIGKRKFSG